MSKDQEPKIGLINPSLAEGDTIAGLALASNPEEEEEIYPSHNRRVDNARQYGLAIEEAKNHYDLHDVKDQAGSISPEGKSEILERVNPDSKSYSDHILNSFRHALDKRMDKFELQEHNYFEYAGRIDILSASDLEHHNDLRSAIVNKLEAGQIAGWQAEKLLRQLQEKVEMLEITEAIKNPKKKLKIHPDFL